MLNLLNCWSACCFVVESSTVLFFLKSWGFFKGGVVKDLKYFKHFN